MKLSLFGWLLASPAFAAQQEIAVEVLGADGRTKKAVLTVESDPWVARTIWKGVTFGIPSALFASQGQSFDDYLSRPRYVRALEIVENGKRQPVSLSAADTKVLLHYFQNPTPGNVWAVRTGDGEYVASRLDGLQVQLDGKNRIQTISGRATNPGNGGPPAWKSMTSGDVAQIYRPEASIAYRSETRDLPRLSVATYPKVLVTTPTGERIPARLLWKDGETVNVVTEAGYESLRQSNGNGSTPEYSVPPESIRLVTDKVFSAGVSGDRSIEALKPFQKGVISSLPPPSSAAGCLPHLAGLVRD